jgi:hypothetical protein
MSAKVRVPAQMCTELCCGVCVCVRACCGVCVRPAGTGPLRNGSLFPGWITSVSEQNTLFPCSHPVLAPQLKMRSVCTTVRLYSVQNRDACNLGNEKR